MSLNSPLSITGWVLCLVGCGLARPAAADLNACEQAPGIYTGAAPTTAADFAELRRLQIHNVIDMRKFRPHDSRRERERVTQQGLVYHSVPIGFFPTKSGSPECVLRLLADCSRHPVYIHCQLGRDRTGLIIALYRVRHLGWSPAAAYAAMQRQEFNPLLRDLDRYFWQNAG